jgi:hypothetical protein
MYLDGELDGYAYPLTTSCTILRTGGDYSKENNSMRRRLTVAAAGVVAFAASVAMAPMAAAGNNPYRPECYVFSTGVDKYFSNTPNGIPYAAGRLKSKCSSNWQSYAWIDAPFGNDDSGCFAVYTDGLIHTYRYEMRTALQPFGTWVWRFCKTVNNKSVKTSTAVPRYDPGSGGGGSW